MKSKKKNIKVEFEQTKHELQLAFNEDCVFNIGIESYGYVLTHYQDILSESVGISILTCGKLREKKKMLDPIQVLHTFPLGCTLANSCIKLGGGGGISQVRPFDLHVRARSCRAITTGTLYQLHRSGSELHHPTPIIGDQWRTKGTARISQTGAHK